MPYRPLTKKQREDIQQTTRDVIEMSENAGRFCVFQHRVLQAFKAGRISQTKALRLMAPAQQKLGA